MKMAIRKIGVAVLALAMVLSSVVCLTVGITASAENGEIISDFVILNDYQTYMADFKDYAAAKEDIILTSANLNPASTVKISAEPIYEESNCIVFENEGDKAIFDVVAPENGKYNLKFDYAALQGGTAMDIQLTIYVDGEILWDSMQKLELLRWWKNSKDEWTVDRYGDQVAPEQTEVFAFHTQYAFDKTGVENEYYQIPLSAGTHRIEVVLKQEPFALKAFSLTAPKNVKKFIELAKELAKYEEYKGKDIVIQGEDANEKNNIALTAKSDSLSAGVEPQSPYNNVINYVGGDTWNEPMQTLRWNFEIEESGLYEIGMHFKQSGVVNGSVYRWLRIDGITPFAEAKVIEFDYDSNWQYLKLADAEGKPCKVYLEKGEHYIDLSVTLGPMSEHFNDLQKIVEKLGDQYLKISMITGETPDANRDYDLFGQIPDLEKSLTQCLDELNSLHSNMKKDSDKSSSQYLTTIKGTTRILNQMLERKYLAHTYKSDYYTQYTNLSSLMFEMRSMPLSIDEIRFTSANSTEPKYSNFWKEIEYTVLSFIASFTKDYESANKTDAKVTLKLWTMWGRDQTQVLNSLIAESFTPKTGIDVDVQITGATLIQGMLTNNAPDMALGVARSNPVNYAMRGALYNLSKFPDLDEALKQFNEGAAEPYYYKGNCYALPDTQSFYIMYYRKDILKNLGLSVPRTWDEFLETTAVIQRNNMNVILPNSGSTTTLDMGLLPMYNSLLMQNNLEVYNKDRNKCVLDTDASINVFTWWTDLYVKYGLPVTGDFYNRFRIGVSPIGIAAYQTYTTISQTAPDIEGRWGIALLPGTQMEDGSINRAASGSGTGCVILKDSKYPKEAWEFLKWWTSADTQYRYSKSVESLLGATGRVATSNIEAFSNYAWENDDLDILLEQWTHIREVPEVPGSYYLVRAVDQAFLEVYNGKATPTDALIRWTAVANEEIDRKVKEYS